jgi:hypothetical protein
MKTLMRKLAGATMVVAAALGTGRPQSAAQEIRLRDIKAQQPQVAISASAPCQRARESSRHSIYEFAAIDPKALVQDLNTLTEKSDEVILAGALDGASVISPNGNSTATYEDVRVIRSWKGSHHGGDTLTFGIPFGEVSCEPTVASLTHKNTCLGSFYRRLRVECAGSRIFSTFGSESQPRRMSETKKSHIVASAKERRPILPEIS